MVGLGADVDVGGGGAVLVEELLADTSVGLGEQACSVASPAKQCA